jgi:hypothetical protein
MGLLDSAAGAVGSVVGGALGVYGAEQVNMMNWKIAQAQMDFQREMYQNRYQYTMEDMRAAGLNPIFAYQSGVGSTPNGASASMINPYANVGEAVNSAVSNSLATRKNKAEVKVMEELARRHASEKTLADKRGLREFQETQNLKAQNDVINHQLLKLQQEITSISNSNATYDMFKKSLETRGQFEKDHPGLLKFDRIMESLGRLLGGGNSAVDLLNKTK